MDLKDFIVSALTDIVEGIESASNSFTARDGCINPKVYGRPCEGDSVIIAKSEKDASGRILCRVRFSVSVTESRSGDSSGNLRVVFGSLRGGLRRSKARETRLEFEVPCLLPDFPVKSERSGRGE